MYEFVVQSVQTSIFVTGIVYTVFFIYKNNYCLSRTNEFL